VKWEERGGYIETGRAEDVEARKLKHLTTKPCPKCGVRIEKSGGCPVSDLHAIVLGFRAANHLRLISAGFTAHDVCAAVV
jgi:hypothetical protein